MNRRGTISVQRYAGQILIRATDRTDPVAPVVLVRTLVDTVEQAKAVTRSLHAETGFDVWVREDVGDD